ncbi:UdgX family uracil-DNA binding protein [Oricola cellulosilytica]|uniref:Type-4 uracil-DNA glycosylase n=1 Tax=Oricola cellulosilytica TaxID=1429082 RepID=A0A4R0P3D0_9HYPH|nr:UdgX family uracil-DNA binding protein [Oricola cellulosilytica]TCD11360.1 DUF4130 domain-containing protein [Oricola cellulosilytica]
MITARLEHETDFDGWRRAARALALNGIAPAEVVWQVEGSADEDLFGIRGDPVPPASNAAVLNITREFVERAGSLVCHRDPQRFAFMYRMLLRLAENKELLKFATDPDVRQMEAMEKSIGRDVHKMRAFVRFRKIGEGAEERFVAWFEPEHHIVQRNAEFFVKRFTGMKWAILTPDRSARWDGETLSVGPGAKKADLPPDDATEDLWKTYFSSIFNPARLKVKAMQAEMPKKYWKNMPEADLIPGLIAGAGKAHEAMIERAPTLPPPSHRSVQARYWNSVKDMADESAHTPEAKTLEELRAATAGCTRCPLYRGATQAVFGEGPADADLLFVGEQPGDQEDIEGRPFVGPAGQLLDQILAEVGIDRSDAYVTNAVKHFKFEPRGKRRIHQTPNAGEVEQCRWWLEKEIELVGPKLLVALGATAAAALLGRRGGIMRERGSIQPRAADGLPVLLTYHPSFLLRIPDQAGKARERANLAQDLMKARDWLAGRDARREAG